MHDILAANNRRTSGRPAEGTTGNTSAVRGICMSVYQVLELSECMYVNDVA